MSNRDINSCDSLPEARHPVLKVNQRLGCILILAFMLMSTKHASLATALQCYKLVYCRLCCILRDVWHC